MRRWGRGCFFPTRSDCPGGGGPTYPCPEGTVMQTQASLPTSSHPAFPAGHQLGLLLSPAIPALKGASLASHSLR